MKASLTNLESNEINAAWELAGWVSLSEAEIETLKVDYDRKQVFADRLATVKANNYIFSKSKLLSLNRLSQRLFSRSLRTLLTKLWLTSKRRDPLMLRPRLRETRKTPFWRKSSLCSRNKLPLGVEDDKQL